MRLALKFSVNAPFKIPVSYQQHIQGLLYELIEDETFASFLHDEGFGETRKFKLFTFSLLKGSYRFDKASMSLIFDDYFYLEVASVIEPFIEAITRSLVRKKTLQLNRQPIHLDNMQIITKKIHKSVVNIEMLSPLCVYKTVDDGEHKKTHYFSPKDHAFNTSINENFKRKFNAYNPVEVLADITIEPLDVKPKDKLVLRFKDFVIIAYKGKYRLKGKPHHLDFLHNTGLGTKNSMGFGMFKVLS